MDSMESLSWFSKLGIHPIWLPGFLIEFIVLCRMLKIKNKAFLIPIVLVVNVPILLVLRHFGSIVYDEFVLSRLVVFFVLIPSLFMLKAFIYYKILKKYRLMEIVKALLISTAILVVLALLILISGFGPYIGMPIISSS